MLVRWLVIHVQLFPCWVRGVWQVSPHELLQAITVASKKNFKIGKQAEAIDLLSWFLNQIEG